MSSVHAILDRRTGALLRLFRPQMETSLETSVVHTPMQEEGYDGAIEDILAEITVKW